MTGKRILPVLVLAILAVAGVPSDAAAWGRGGCFGRAAGCYGASAGCYGVASACYGSSSNCYGVSSGCYGTASCYANGNGGPLRRLAASIRSRHASAYACTGRGYGSSNCYGSSSCYGNSGCYGSSCYSSSGCYGSCYAACHGSVTSSCYSAPSDGCYASGYTVSPSYATPPATQTIIQPQTIPSTVPPSNVTPSAAAPSIVTPPAGDQTRDDSVDASALASDATPPSTLLRLHVPAHAKVVLEDAQTRLVGSERTFRTAQLAAGEVWSNYCVRVVVERAGEPVIVQEKYVDLRGGESHELRFDFDDALLASH